MARVGVFLPQYRLAFETLAERVAAVEALGFDSVWFMDHLSAPLVPEADCFEAWTTASALAARTTRLRLGHLVLCDPFRHPALLAKMAATLDVISAGRLDLGLGWGSVTDELSRFGIGDAPARVRAERLAETLEILDRLFTGEPVDHAGRHYTLRGAQARPVPVQRPLPIHLGGAGEKLTLPLVAEWARRRAAAGGELWWNCPSYASARLAELAPRVAGARISVQHPVGLVTEPSQREAVQKLAERRFGSWGGLLVGTPEEVGEALQREARLGAELFVLQFHDFGEPATLERFAHEALPALSD